MSVLLYEHIEGGASTIWTHIDKYKLN